ncbi:hypothetical protein IMZ48_17140, partial [Candidatus Bathyarchaeota archaeon]|nr:hypothetical protein [Candidatus Bathyarchaeota archaeon]
MSRHNTAAPGFSQAHDPFMGLTNAAEAVDGALDFEETYDGLADQLDETDDAFNDDTFGESDKVGKDFDFFGRTAKVSDAFEEEHLRFSRHAPVPAARVAPAPAPVAAYPRPAYPGPAYPGPASYNHQPLRQPVRTGYEKYKEPETVPDLHVDHSIWGMAPPKRTPQPTQQVPVPAPAPSRRVMSLEEVEAAMRAQAMPQSQPQAQQPPPQPTQM